jgi:hypothetical protein
MRKRVPYLQSDWPKSDPAVLAAMELPQDFSVVVTIAGASKEYAVRDTLDNLMRRVAAKFGS